MPFSLTSLIMDAADPESERAFWHRLLGGSITRTATHHFLQIDGFPVIVIQHAPGHLPPQWPDGASQQMHFDLATDDAAAADKRVLAAGGRRLRPTDDADASARQGARVYAARPDIPSASGRLDPAGCGMNLHQAVDPAQEGFADQLRVEEAAGGHGAVAQQRTRSSLPGKCR